MEDLEHGYEDDAEGRGRVRRHEARLDHPHVVAIYEVGQAEGLLYIATRLVPGGTLADLNHTNE